MRAVRYERYGGPEVLELTERPIPEPRPGRVRIRVRAVGINPADQKMRRGLFDPGSSAPQQPRGTGLEVAGLVDAVGEPIEQAELTESASPGGPGELSVGQGVFGTVSAGAAEYVLAKPENLVLKPDWLSFERAAALPLASEAAYRTVVRLFDIRDGQILLIHAAAGAVGLVAAQLALARGAQVIGTASEPRHEFLRSIGVWPVAYGDDWEARVAAVATAGVDRVLDASGRGVLPGSVRLAGGSDHVITIADMTDAAQHGVRFTSGPPVPMAEVFDTVLPLVQQGRMLLPIHHTYRLDQIAEAHQDSENGHHLGKLMISLP